jgi:hypothetical protein
MEPTKKHNTENKRYEPWNPPKNTTQKTKDMSHRTHQKTQHRKLKI